MSRDREEHPLERLLNIDSRYRHAWEVPDCPECDGHVFVARAIGTGGDWQCHAPWCEANYFDASRVPDRLRGVVA